MPRAQTIRISFGFAYLRPLWRMGPVRGPAGAPAAPPGGCLAPLGGGPRGPRGSCGPQLWVTSALPQGEGRGESPPVELARLTRGLQQRLQAPPPQHVGISERFGASRPQGRRQNVAGAAPTRPLRGPAGPLRWPRGASASPKGGSCKARWGPVGHCLGAAQLPKNEGRGGEAQALPTGGPRAAATCAPWAPAGSQFSACWGRAAEK